MSIESFKVRLSIKNRKLINLMEPHTKLYGFNLWILKINKFKYGKQKSMVKNC